MNRALLDFLKATPGVLVTEKKNSKSFTITGKVFGFFNKAGLVLKLPLDRVATMVADGSAVHLMMGKRLMKEWVIVDTADNDLQTLCNEAMAFVATSSP